MNQILTPEQVGKTEQFKKLSKTAQMSYNRRMVREHLTNGLNVARHMGFDKWERQSGFSQSDKNIIQELLNEEQCL